MEENEVNNVSGSEIKQQRSNNRVFAFFLILDLVLLGLIIYEIIALATGSK